MSGRHLILLAIFVIAGCGPARPMPDFNSSPSTLSVTGLEAEVGDAMSLFKAD